jgi:hypothetical protein
LDGGGFPVVAWHADGLVVPSRQQAAGDVGRDSEVKLLTKHF